MNGDGPGASGAPATPLVHSDDFLVAFDKPAGLLTIPGRAPDQPTLWRLGEALLGRRLWVVHRLDRDTSGLVVFALDAATHRALSLAFERRQVAKTYLARVAPPPPSGLQELRHRLRPARGGFMRLAADGETGQVAETTLAVLEAAEGQALVELSPRTGRTHQLRLQLASIGSPIVGDPHYRAVVGIAPPAAARMWLHAERLRFTHPATERRLELLAARPAGLWPAGRAG